MSMDRFSVCHIPQSMFEEIKDIDRSSKRALKQWLYEHTTELLWANLDDRFQIF